MFKIGDKVILNPKYNKIWWYKYWCEVYNGMILTIKEVYEGGIYICKEVRIEWKEEELVKYHPPFDFGLEESDFEI